ncbi:bifunctional DNA-formamidopyrimidine glycosylase/DNA-(apurinic or apyrimidinic site) lyase [Desulfonatronovibrio hydrogenovorans]|uniref:bifunctional DNA-formamidopyrimidine glycosylase/DNA-(apurinic or apyrimidinic site) lyase n=1 Tax=Desulfonatronovibrio hydrogenovorans TaxID=53245 RepID=UPI0004918C60|nr:bifunctional DNA-formamidopyrimidine glycosylase/DNA-(apurinic or apyrimidinic site) lyase [Desulfonatronovibrio hydrogenovorans]
MPELPEVETIARGLAPLVVHRTIASLDLRYTPIVKDDPDRFARKVPGHVITRVWRRAKLLILDLGVDFHLVFHLKMTGKVWVPGQGIQPDKHTHLIFDLNDGFRIFFQDQRKFGYCALFDEPGLKNWSFFADLGPEPLEMPTADFIEIFQQKKGRIKALLLDQKNIAGIGNIYADESLFMAGIHPETPGWSLGRQELARLHSCLQEVLCQAIDAGGSSFRDYKNALGYAGMFQEKFLVYGKKGCSCPRCKTGIETRKVAGRTTCFCPECQKLPNPR